MLALNARQRAGIAERRNHGRPLMKKIDWFYFRNR